MALNLTTAPAKQATNFGRVEDGTYPARIVQIIDLGMQLQYDWQTQEQKFYDDGNPVVKPEVIITYEFPTETVEIKGETKPRWLGKTYTLSLHEKAALTNLLKVIGGGSTNVGDLLGKPAGVTVGSTSGGKAKIAAVNALMAGVVVPELVNPSVLFDADEPDMEALAKMPEWIRVKITGSESWKAPEEAAPVAEVQQVAPVAPVVAAQVAPASVNPF